MKTLLQIVSVAALAFGLSSSAFAKDGKEVSLAGEAKCAKCALKLKGVEKCQNVLEVKKDDKTELFYLKGEVSDKFHKQICGETKEVKLKGELAETDGKKWIVVSDIKVKEGK
jgi:hypothetical protein